MRTEIINVHEEDKFDGSPYTCVRVAYETVIYMIDNNLCNKIEMSKTHYYSKDGLSVKDIKKLDHELLSN